MKAMLKDKDWNNPSTQSYLKSTFISEELGQYDNYKQWEKEQYKKEKELEAFRKRTRGWREKRDKAWGTKKK